MLNHWKKTNFNFSGHFILIFFSVKFCFVLFCFNLAGAWLIYNIGFQVCSKVIQLYIYIYSFFRFFSHIGYHRIFELEFFELYSRSLLVSYLIYSRVCMFTPSS